MSDKQRVAFCGEGGLRARKMAAVELACGAMRGCCHYRWGNGNLGGGWAGTNGLGGKKLALPETESQRGYKA